MIIQAFLRWIETAKTGDRIRAAEALGRAYVDDPAGHLDRDAAEMAMTFLLDDPSPKVRLALAQALAEGVRVPRSIILSLSQDQPETAHAVISRSPVFTDADLVDLAARATPEIRALIAARRGVSRAVAAAIAEIGDEAEVLILMENPDACLSRRTLKRLSDRLGHVCTVREMLLAREDLPADARHALAEKLGEALGVSHLVTAVMGERRAQNVVRETCARAAVVLSGAVSAQEIPLFVVHLRDMGRLTPSFLMQCLCAGHVDFFAAALADLSGIPERRVRSVLSDGRVHALRAVFESAGLGRDFSSLFAEAALLWRRENAAGRPASKGSMSSVLLAKLRKRTQSAAVSQGLADLVETLSIADMRNNVRHYAALTARNEQMRLARDAA